MISEQENKFSLSDELQDYLGLTPRQRKVILREYMLIDESDQQLFNSTIKYFLRKDYRFNLSSFSKIEWLIIVLFYRFGMNLSMISSLVRYPESRVKLCFFSAKEKLIIMEKQCSLAHS